ncbi:PKD domain-containing protein [Patescibacteria group bacterium]|nr:PKD domain-containing protein [Patescibacteria group bacterium]
MRRTMMILLALVLFTTNAWALTKPIDVRDYDMTYSGVVGTGTLDYIGTVNGTLYRDNQDDGATCGCGYGEGKGGHPAVDVPCSVTPIFAIASGEVVSAGWDSRGFGNTIVVRHDSGDIPSLTAPQDVIYVCYSHLSSISVSVGSVVYEGQTIGATGNSGPSTYHLHFQIDRYKRLDTGQVVSTSNTNISSNTHPFLPSPYLPNVQDPLHELENYTINPMAFLQMDSYDPCYVPVGFVLNEDYSGYPTWRTDGLSQAFRDKYDSYVFEGQDTPQHGAIGFPWDNAPDWVSYGQAVHKVDDMWIQDFYGPNNGLTLPYSALIKGDGTAGVYLLKEGFWDYWVNNAGWEVFGYPVTDEYMVGEVPHQTFVKDGQQIVFAWEGGSEPDVEYMSGISANMYNVTFTSLAKVAGDGVYHSGLSVTDFGDPIEMIEGRTYDGFYAMVGGEQELIGPFTVNGDMTIIVGEIVPTANFTATPTFGTVPLTVQFTDTSVNNPTSWVWTFGEGSTSASQHPSFTYNGAGDFTISLTASNGSGGDTITKTSYIHVYPPVPTANFSATPTFGANPLTVQFFDQSTNSPTSWAWDFGDGANSSVEDPVHTYTTAGVYTVSLTASNGSGSDTVIKTNLITVNDPIPPIADFRADVTSGPAPLTVQFTDQSSGQPYSWYWNFGDGNDITGEGPHSNTYTSAGVYDVYLYVANQYGSDILTRYAYITVADPSGCTGNGAYHFDGVNQYLAVGVMVGGVFGSETTVEAWVKLDRNNVEQNIYSYWNVDPYKMFNLYVDNTGHLVGERYGTTPSSVVGSTVLTVDEWYYVVMVSKHGEPTKVYVNGVLDGTSTTVLDTPNTSSALLGSMAAQNYNGTYINYLEGVIDEVRVSTVARTATEISNYYSSAAEMMADANTATLWHMNGEAGTADKTAGVAGTVLLRDLEERNNPQATSGFNECLPLVADFIATPISVYTGNPVQFTDQSTGEPTSWNWSFGDGNTSTVQNPTYTYGIHGIYTVSLIVANAAEADTLVRTDYITSSKPPEDNDVYPHSEPNPSNPLAVIAFKMEKTGHATVAIYDIRGRKVQTLLDQTLSAGVHEVIFDGKEFVSGTYFYMICSAEGTDVRKITLVK